MVFDFSSYQNVALNLSLANLAQTSHLLLFHNICNGNPHYSNNYSEDHILKLTAPSSKIVFLYSFSFLISSYQIVSFDRLVDQSMKEVFGFISFFIPHIPATTPFLLLAVLSPLTQAQHLGIAMRITMGHLVL